MTLTPEMLDEMEAMLAKAPDVEWRLHEHYQDDRRYSDEECAALEVIAAVVKNRADLLRLARIGMRAEGAQRWDDHWDCGTEPCANGPYLLAADVLGAEGGG